MSLNLPIESLDSSMVGRRPAATRMVDLKGWSIARIQLQPSAVPGAARMGADFSLIAAWGGADDFACGKIQPIKRGIVRWYAIINSVHTYSILLRIRGLSA